MSNAPKKRKIRRGDIRVSNPDKLIVKATIGQYRVIDTPPILKAVCTTVEPGEDVAYMIRTMYQALMATKNGVGLAANQVGYNKRIIIILVDGFYQVMINPVIIDKSEDMISSEEGCLSFPGIGKDIERHRWVKVEWMSQSGHVSREMFGQSGDAARRVQHEIDHLDGNCLVSEGKRV